MTKELNEFVEFLDLAQTLAEMNADVFAEKDYPAPHKGRAGRRGGSAPRNGISVASGGKQGAFDSAAATMRPTKYIPYLRTLDWDAIQAERAAIQRDIDSLRVAGQEQIADENMDAYQDLSNKAWLLGETILQGVYRGGKNSKETRDASEQRKRDIIAGGRVPVELPSGRIMPSDDIEAQMYGKSMRTATKEHRRGKGAGRGGSDAGTHHNRAGMSAVSPAVAYQQRIRQAAIPEAREQAVRNFVVSQGLNKKPKSKTFSPNNIYFTFGESGSNAPTRTIKSEDGLDALLALATKEGASDERVGRI